MKKLLLPEEMVVGDEGYKDEACLLGSDVVGDRRKILAIIRARQETVNRSFEQVFVLGHRSRHAIDLHSVCFHAVANITQVVIETGSPLFQVQHTV